MLRPSAQMQLPPCLQVLQRLKPGHPRQRNLSKRKFKYWILTYCVNECCVYGCCDWYSWARRPIYTHGEGQSTLKEIANERHTQTDIVKVIDKAVWPSKEASAPQTHPWNRPVHQKVDTQITSLLPLQGITGSGYEWKIPLNTLLWLMMTCWVKWKKV